jgi:Tol biopolymer transport system component
MDSDGSNPVRLTTGNGEKVPRCSPDGKWVIYHSVAASDEFYSLWKIPIEGGQPVRLADRTYAASISPDGKRIVFSRRLWTSDIMLLTNSR